MSSKHISSDDNTPSDGDVLEKRDDFLSRIRRWHIVGHMVGCIMGFFEKDLCFPHKEKGKILE